MAASTWTWLGNSDIVNSATNWSLISGPGNSKDRPQSGDTAIFSGAGTAPQFIDQQLSGGNTFDLTGSGTVQFLNDQSGFSNVSTIDSSVTINAEGTATSILTAGTFTNGGTVEVTGTGNALTIDITSEVTNNGTQTGWFENDGSIFVDQGDSLTISGAVGATFAGFGTVVVDGGSALVNAALPNFSNDRKFRHQPGRLAGDRKLRHVGAAKHHLRRLRHRANRPAGKFHRHHRPVRTRRHNRPHRRAERGVGGLRQSGRRRAARVERRHAVLHPDQRRKSGQQQQRHLRDLRHRWAHRRGRRRHRRHRRRRQYHDHGDASAHLAMDARRLRLGRVKQLDGGRGPARDRWAKSGRQRDQRGWHRRGRRQHQPQQQHHRARRHIRRRRVHAHQYGYQRPGGNNGNNGNNGGNNGGGNNGGNNNGGNSPPSFQNPSIDDKSEITSDVQSAGSFTGNTTAERSLLGSAGYFVNEGTIAADGPTGSSFTLAITGTTVSGTLLPGYFINYSTIDVAAGNSMTITVDGTSELYNVGEIVVSGGSLLFDAAAGAIDGGYAGGLGSVLIEDGGTVETDASYPSNSNSTSGIYGFADETSGNTLKIDYLGSFGGVILGFAQNDTIDLGGSLSISSVNTVVYSATTGILNLENNSGTIVGSC